MTESEKSRNLEFGNHTEKNKLIKFGISPWLPHPYLWEDVVVLRLDFLNFGMKNHFYVCLFSNLK